MTANRDSLPRRLATTLLLLGGGFLITTLAWLGYRAINEWQRSAAMLAQRRAEASVDLLLVAITRDMRGVQSSILSSLRFDQLGPHVTLELHGVASAFARYPYPEAFFAVRGRPTPDAVTFYTRGDRPPSWTPKPEEPTRFPVIVGVSPPFARVLLNRIESDVADGRRFSFFNLQLGGHAYQVVALLSYIDPFRDRLTSIVGFVVNLDWVRENYFHELAAQVMRIQVGAEGGLSLAIEDANGEAVVPGSSEPADAPASSRNFPMLFFDPSLIALAPPADVDTTPWTARATVAGDRALGAARVGARRTLIVAAMSALILGIGSALTVRATRANVRLMAMRSDFVSAVTHELKTPIATIRAISETLASGRSSHPEMSREYAQLAVHEAKRLTRLIDNLLAYSRIADVTDAYSFEPLAVDALARHSLKEFQSQLSTAGFTVSIDIPDDLPLVRADRASMVLALGNLVDNAIRYSNGTRQLAIAAHADAESVVIEVSDAGTGIPEAEIEHVTRKFFRGHGAISGGSGLGLSIAQRIVSDHAGSLSIRSVVDAGTTVSITLHAITGSP